ncbi:MlaD family protein [Rhodococcus erythropolis]|uniref:MlaD family protein n=1 Tax=Rhodococcus erythropolis TaxID=1833 RepID=UPI002109DFF6|nr:MlaD family protein [Rhodococcus erythropolis]MCQ4127666.1 MlaD family protein [Rhodococcus erythropolis]
MKAQSVLSLAALATTTVIGASYLCFGVLELAPARESLTAVVELESTGGLMNTSPVTLRGVEIGKVTDIRAVTGHIEAHIRIDDPSTRIAADSMFTVTNLSIAGEQFLDITPGPSDREPIRGGDVIPVSQVVATATIAELLSSVSNLTDQIDPEALEQLARTAAELATETGPQLDNLALTANLLSGTIENKLAALTRIYSRTQLILDKSEGFGNALSAGAAEIPATEESLAHFLRALRTYGQIGHGMWDETMIPFVDLLNQWFSGTAPVLGTVGRSIAPYTAPIRDHAVDAGSALDVLFRAFPENGGIRIVIR